MCATLNSARRKLRILVEVKGGGGFNSNPKFSAAHLLHQRYQSTVAPLTLTLLWCHLPGATLAPVLSAFELVVIVVASHWLFGLGLLMTEQAEQKLVARVGASAAFPLAWHWTTVDF